MSSQKVKVLGILQARVSSSRLPGKVLKPVLGQPMLARQLERLRLVTQIDQLIVATSLDPSDDAIATLCQEENTPCFRGSLDDVLDRFYQAASTYKPLHIVRLTGDCPLADPALIDQVINTHLNSNYDYTSNCLTPSYPDGLDVEVFRYSCLEHAWHEASLASEREHVTPYIRKPELGYRLHDVQSEEELSGLRWTVDEAEDLELVNAIFSDLYPKDPNFNMKDILALLRKRPELSSLNSHHVRNAGLQKSLQDDYLALQQETGHE